MPELTAEQQALLAKPANAAYVIQSLRAEALARCAEDPLFFLQFVRTRDEADPTQTVKPFPVHKDYIRRLFHLFATEQRIVIAKSRQLLVSWAVCCWMVYRARFTPHAAIYYQTKKEDDADGMVALANASADGGVWGRCEFIERMLPSWLQQDIKPAKGKISYPNGSLIQAVPGGADQIRSKVGTVLVMDEYAFLPEAKASYTAIAPLVQKGAQLIVISTPNGGRGNAFFHLWHGEPFDE